MIIFLWFFVPLEAAQLTFGHTDADIDPHKMSFISVSLSALEVDDLRNVTVNKAVKRAPVFTEAERFELGIDRVFDHVNAFRCTEQIHSLFGLLFYTD